MSVCSGPDYPNRKALNVEPPQLPQEWSIEDLEAQLTELRSLRPDARALARSGNPGLRAEGEQALARIEEGVSYINGLLRKVKNAQL